MYELMIGVIAVHALAGVFWAGSTSALANLGAAANAERLFPFQMGSAGLTVLTGLALWSYWRAGAFGLSEQILLVGIVAAIAAGGVQGVLVGSARRDLAKGERESEPVLRSRMALAHRIAAGLLTVTVVCMVVNRFF